MAEVQENGQLRARRASPSNTPAQSNHPTGPINAAPLPQTHNEILPIGYELSDVVRERNRSLPFVYPPEPIPWSLLITSIPDPAHPARPCHPSHPSWSRYPSWLWLRPIAREADNNDTNEDNGANSSTTSDEPVPSPPGQEDWVNNLVATCPLEDERLLRESRRLRAYRLAEAEAEQRRRLELPRRQIGYLCRQEREARRMFLPGMAPVGKILPLTRDNVLQHNRLLQEQQQQQHQGREHMQRLITRFEPHTGTDAGTCACINENGNEREGEWTCYPPQHGDCGDNGGHGGDDGQAREKREQVQPGPGQKPGPSTSTGTSTNASPNSSLSANTTPEKSTDFQIPPRSNCAIQIRDPDTRKTLRLR